MKGVQQSQAFFVLAGSGSPEPAIKCLLQSDMIKYDQMMIIKL